METGAPKHAGVRRRHPGAAPPERHRGRRQRMGAPLVAFSRGVDLGVFAHL